MKTLVNVGATSNSLWWALNGVSLLFACSKCGTTVHESPYTGMILLCESGKVVEKLILLLAFILQAVLIAPFFVWGFSSSQGIYYTSQSSTFE